MNDRSPDVLVTPVPACKLKHGDTILTAFPAADAVRVKDVYEIVRANEDVTVYFRMGGEILCPDSQVFYKVKARKEHS